MFHICLSQLSRASDRSMQVFSLQFLFFCHPIWPIPHSLLILPRGILSPHVRCIRRSTLRNATAGSVVSPSTERLLYLLWLCVPLIGVFGSEFRGPTQYTIALIFRPRHAEVLDLIEQRMGSVHRVANPYPTWSSSKLVYARACVPPSCLCVSREAPDL